MTTPSSSPRECGPCTACCTAEGVHELHKPPGETCQFVCAQGCANYERRPPSCREFACLWLQGAFDADLRPDGLGVVFSLTPAPASMHPWRRYVRAMEAELGASTRPKCAELIRWLASKGEVVWVYPADGNRPDAKVVIHYPDGQSLTIDPGFTFERQLAQIELIQQGATPQEAMSRFPPVPFPPPRPAQEWLRDRDARRVIERNKPIPALQRAFLALREAGARPPS
ncbi:MAG: hypothetical protein JNL08_21755 [Planctomycetes bacterium]|nr:hypothetical protein [Planctomycetota bacterium]